ncbi:SDR family oxidoreductase [Nocardia sp. CA2R105]|uniref:SDR family NAD(P)-dependent oxidoreductase n=1 Tax=Nocardia coffeae TaxID=2873381 RepID=UPI001CA62DF9|nr:SDR family oxidoreductase [Nocardia coffeae]MBY8862954.1 SDR family oxidoreductase [Nocardia coffeae]
MTATEGVLAGKTALITGVSAGLGRAVATAFVEAGASVVGTARRADQGAKLEAELGTERFAFETADVSRTADCERLVAATVERFGRLDVLVCNAAVRPEPPLMTIEDTDEATWDRVIDTNVKGPFFLAKYALGPMRAQGSGVILTIASTTAAVAVSGMSVYATSKAALAHLTRHIAVEYLDEGVRANTILLGGTATGQQNRTTQAKAATGAPVDAQAMAVPGAPLHDSSEVAKTLVTLASDGASAITGATIAVDHAESAGLWASRYVHLTIDAQRSAG